MSDDQKRMMMDMYLAGQDGGPLPAEEAGPELEKTGPEKRGGNGGAGYLALAAAGVALMGAVVVFASDSRQVEQRAREQYGVECFDLKDSAVRAHRKLDSLDRSFLREPKEEMNNAETRGKYLVKRAELDREFTEKAMLWRKCIEKRQRNSPNVAAQPKTVPRTARSNL